MPDDLTKWLRGAKQNGVPYTEKFRSELVAKMMGPQGMSACALSRKVGIRQPTLSRWLKAARAGAVSKPSKPRGRPSAKRWTAEEKLRVMKLAAGLEGSALGELLRKEGLHEADLKRFEAEALSGLAPRRSSERP